MCLRNLKIFCDPQIHRFTSTDYPEFFKNSKSSRNREIKIGQKASFRLMGNRLRRLRELRPLKSRGNGRKPQPVMNREKRHHVASAHLALVGGELVVASVSGD